MPGRATWRRHQDGQEAGVRVRLRPRPLLEFPRKDKAERAEYHRTG